MSDREISLGWGALAPPRFPADDEGQQLATWINDLFRGQFAGRTIDRVTIMPGSTAGSFANHLATVWLAGGDTMALWVKNFGSGAGARLKTLRHAIREVQLYRHFLSAIRLGGPNYHGVEWDETRQRYWLLLEFVRGRNGFERRPPLGRLAARWLAQCQTSFQSHPQADRLRSLLWHPPQTPSAHHALIPQGWPRGRPAAVRAALQRALDRYSLVTRQISLAPKSITHGQFDPRHVWLDPDAARPRLLVVDWEHARWDCCYLDLAMLACWWQPDAADELLATYLEECERLTGQAVRWSVAYKTWLGCLVYASFDQLRRIIRHPERGDPSAIVSRLDAWSAQLEDA